MVAEFIKIKHSLNEALSYRASGQEDRYTYEFGGVQLLPNHVYPYVQRTQNPDGIEIEDSQVWVCDTCGNELQDITDYFNITRIFQDLNGKPQIEWSLNQVPFDFAYRLVLLKIQQGIDDIFYTTPFYLTNDGSELTSRWDYQQDFNDTMLSCQLQVYFRDYDSALNIASYNQVRNGKRTAQNVQNTEFERWKTQNVDKAFFKEFRNIFLSRIIYVDLALSGLYDGFETPAIEFDQNFLEASFNITRDESQLYDPNYIAPPVPPPPPVESEIILDEVESINSGQVRFSWHYVNFAPGYVTLEFAESPSGSWTPSTGSPISPRIFNVPNHLTEGYYYRVSSGSIHSNILQLAIPALQITAVTGQPGYFLGTGNTYYIDWEATGYTPVTNLSFEGSTDGATWQPMYYNTGNQDPKQIQAPSSGTEFKFFRIKDNSNGIISNIFEHEF